MRLSGLKLIASFFLAAILSAPAWAATPALPGTLNYIEGQASIGTEALNNKSVGSVDLQTGQTLTTQTGKAEVLLTPGVFFRLGDNSAATLVSPDLTNTEMALDKGQAMVEVDNIHKDNLLRVQADGTATQLLKTGIYGFDATNGEIRVFKGEALVQDGDREVKVKGGHELAIENVNPTGKLKTTKFDEKSYEQTDLYRFSDLRSEYLAEANVNAAALYWPGSPGWYGAGWYWDPGFWGYTWLPADGWFASPFGWGFYSPLWIGYGSYYGGYYRGGYGAARPYPLHGPYSAGRVAGESGFRGPSHAAVGASHFGVMGGGFHGGMAGGGFHGGGFAGGGGFHR
jgi:FecR protein